MPTASWVPAAELVVEAAGAVLAVVPGLLGSGEVAAAAAGRVSDQVAEAPAPFSVRLVVRGLPGRGSQADVGFGVPLSRGSLDGGAEGWRQLLAAFGLREDADDAARRLPAEWAATLEAPG